MNQSFNKNNRNNLNQQIDNYIHNNNNQFEYSVENNYSIENNGNFVKNISDLKLYIKSFDLTDEGIIIEKYDSGFIKVSCELKW